MDVVDSQLLLVALEDTSPSHEICCLATDDYLAEITDTDFMFFLLKEVRLHGSNGFFWPWHLGNYK